jgi:hypothetical protein
VFGDTACFPVSERALPGTMAAEVRQLLPHWGFAVEDRRLTVDDLLAADHVFLTSSLMGAVPAVSLGATKLGYDAALCNEINEAVFNEAVFSEAVFDEAVFSEAVFDEGQGRESRLIAPPGEGEEGLRRSARVPHSRTRARFPGSSAEIEAADVRAPQRARQ